jgi:hypothetical protein
MERLRGGMIYGILLLAITITVLPIGTATANQVVLSVPAYGYNTIDGSGNGYDGLTGAIGCGPTTGAMIMEYWTNNGAPGLITNSLADARLMGAGPDNPINTTPLYMDTNNGGFGPSYQFQFGFESFAASRGYDFNAAIHKNATDNPAVDQMAGSGWDMYTFSGPDQNIFYDVNFWNTTTWDIIDSAFIAFIKAEIDAGRPLSASVFGDPNFVPGTILDTGFTSGGANHWMPIVGYDDVTNQWAGLNTWDNTLHWYDTTSAFFDTIPGGNYNIPNMSIAFVRTFDFVGPIENQIPEPSTFLLVGMGLAGVGLFRKRIKR